MKTPLFHPDVEGLGSASAELSINAESLAQKKGFSGEVSIPWAVDKHERKLKLYIEAKRQWNLWPHSQRLWTVSCLAATAVMLPKSDIELGSTACVKDVDGEKCLQPRTDSDPSSLDSRKTTKAPIQRREEPHSQGTEDDGTQMSAPPDGGRVAWLQVLMAFLIACNSWGYICTFGVFQAHYVDTLERSHSDVSWIGSIQVFLVFFIGAFSGRATDAGYFRHCVIAGSICTVVGLFMTSLATTYWQVFLAHGLCLGLGSGLTSCPSLSLLATYFVKRRASVIAIAGFGGGSCGVIFPVIVQRLMPLIGFPWTIRILGFLSLAMAVVAVVCGRSRLPPRTVGPWIELAAFRDRSYVLFTLGMFLVFWGYWIALYFVRFFFSFLLSARRCPVCPFKATDMRPSDRFLLPRHHPAQQIRCHQPHHDHEWCGHRRPGAVQLPRRSMVGPAQYDHPVRAGGWRPPLQLDDGTHQGRYHSVGHLLRRSRGWRPDPVPGDDVKPVDRSQQSRKPHGHGIHHRELCQSHWPTDSWRFDSA